MSDDNKHDITIETEKLLPSNEEDGQAIVSMRDIRSLAFHFIYAMEQFNYEVSLESIIETFKSGFRLDIPSDSKAIYIAQEVIKHREELDKKIKPFLKNWKLERLGLCTRLILRMGIWELEKGETPAKVVINEAIELAKGFAERDAYKFVNGVLDKMINGKEIEDQDE